MSGINNHHTDADDSIVDNFDPLILDNRFTTTNGTNGTGTATMTMSTPLPTFDAEKKKKPRKKRRSNVTKKPPDAPKRFKRYVLVIYSIYRHITLCLRNTEHGNITEIILLTTLLYPTLSRSVVSNALHACDTNDVIFVAYIAMTTANESINNH
jgi:hypothetical protein